MHNIDELARLSGVPSRTIRFYNTQGLLPPPLMRGRVAFYDQEHLLVLQIIKDLKEQQHLSLEIIKQLLRYSRDTGRCADESRPQATPAPSHGSRSAA